VNRKIDPAFKDRLVNLPVEYSPLLKREQRPSLPSIRRSLDDFPIYPQTSILLPDPIDNKISLNQGQLAVSGSDLEKYS